jgi:hypothetical protein
MKLLKYGLISLMLIPLFMVLFIPRTVAAAPVQGGACSKDYINSSGNEVPEPGAPDYSSSFLGLVPWYQYISTSDWWVSINSVTGQPTCGFHIDFTSTTGKGNNEAVTGVDKDSLNAIWLIGLAIFEDLLRVAGVAAVGFVIYGGIRYTTSQGSPEQTSAALGTILHALVGLAIAIIAAASVAFIANQFK